MNENSRFLKCKYGLPDMYRDGNEVKIKCQCRHSGDLIVLEDCEQCETCDKFLSKYIEFPIQVQKIDTEEFEFSGLYRDKVGKFVKVRPCGEEYGGKTFLGIFIGDIPCGNRVTYNREDGTLSVRTTNNPAIFVFELNKIVFGYESWWSVIREGDALDDIQITDDDIQNTWYVRLLKEQFGG